MTFRDPDPRLLRHFTAVAEELHFTRAAARLYIAQQALSRDIRRLEQQLGTDLFSRSTRHVQLTADGERLLPLARAVLAAYDELDAAWTADHRPLLVDVAARASTAHRVLEAARLAEPDVEFAARFLTGLTGAAADILAGRLDVSSGHFAGLPEATRNRLDHRLIRYEHIAVLLPTSHPLAALPEIPLASLRGETLYAAAGNEATAEWTALARSLLTPRGIHLAPPFPEIAGEDEFIRVIRKQGWSVLATTQFTAVPGMTLRPLCEPVPLSPVSLVWRRGLAHPGLTALHEAATRLAAEHDWLRRPPGAWAG